MPNNSMSKAQSPKSKEKSKEKNDKETFYARILNDQGLLFGGKVTAVSSTNDDGKFDILPQHTNFITIIKDSVIVHKADGKKKTHQVDEGVLYCYENDVEIFLGIKTFIEG